MKMGQTQASTENFFAFFKKPDVSFSSDLRFRGEYDAEWEDMDFEFGFAVF